MLFAAPHRARKTQGNHKEINGFRDARTIFSSKLQSYEDFRRGFMFRERIPWVIDDSVTISKTIHVSEEESNAECDFPKGFIGISCFSQLLTGQAKHKEIVRKSLFFVMRGRFFHETAIVWRFPKRIHVSGEDSMNDWWLRDDFEEDPRIGKGNPTQNVLFLRKSLVFHTFRSPPQGMQNTMKT